MFLGAPMPLNGKLYVLIEQAGVMRLLCLDPKALVKAPGPDPTPKPALVWTQKLGKPNSTMPTDSVRRYQGLHARRQRRHHHLPDQLRRGGGR